MLLTMGGGEVSSFLTVTLEILVITKYIKFCLAYFV